ncbi:Lipid-A-disaccharide synthase [Rickettsiales bacterium Ac37b]|nr:Lipid-A-disaccharide synthase [Rickettsiales bacterium Ac37b]
MQNFNLKVFLIAGEASGDNLGAKLMQALNYYSTVPIEFYGIGGNNMEKAGLNSFFPMQELSLIGFFEILPNIRRIIKRINETVQYIKYIKPDIVITIDSPGFCTNVVQKLQKEDIKFVHYVAPSVWAYKPSRAVKFAKLYNHLLALLPFEPPYFEKVGLPCSFVGHPIIEDFDKPENHSHIFKTKYNIHIKDKLLCIMPGSRISELSRLLPIFCKTAKILINSQTVSKIIIITLPHLINKVQNIVNSANLNTIIVANEEEKKAALYSSNIALVKSGTSTLEVAMSKLPMIVAYKVNPLSALLLKILIKIPYVTLINILANKQIIPEFLQNKCTPKILSNALQTLLHDSQMRQTQINASSEAINSLKPNNTLLPSHKAALVILKILKLKN